MIRIDSKRLPVHRGPAAWNLLLGQPDSPVALTGNKKADFVIVGAGFAGLAAACRLYQLQPTARIVVVDAGLLGEGAAGRNSGFMIDLPHVLTSADYAGPAEAQLQDAKAKIALNRQAIAFARLAAEEFDINPAFVDPVGKINGAASVAADRKNHSYAMHLTALAESFERLDAGQMRALTGSAHYLSGLYTPGTVMLQPAGYIRGLAAGLRQRGIEIFEASPVRSFIQKTGGWDVVTAQGTLAAGQVILAVNGHLESFGYARGRLMQLFLFGAMTPELDAGDLRRLGGTARWGITPADPMGTSMRRIDTPLGGNRILTRSCAVLRPGLQTRAADLRRAAAVMQQKFDQRFPALAGLKMAHVWAGHLCLSKNDVSVTGEIEPGLFAACVQNGLGTVRGTLTGIAAAEGACGVTSMITDHFAAEAPPQPLPPRPLLEAGGNLVLRWRECLARQD
jgi:glycine/D-amino acid oxidase-like deaminating enzyme